MFKWQEEIIKKGMFTMFPLTKTNKQKQIDMNTKELIEEMISKAEWGANYHAQKINELAKETDKYVAFELKHHKTELAKEQINIEALSLLNNKNK